MSDTAARLGATYAVLMAAHDLGDHVVQTDHQAATKATSWTGMAGHVGSYTALQVVALTALRAGGVRPSWRRVLAAVAWSAGTHAILDRRRVVAWLLRVTRSPKFAKLETPLNGPYLADQALHHGVLVVAAAILAGDREELS